MTFREVLAIAGFYWLCYNTKKLVFLISIHHEYGFSA